jgi:hypothetical protein
MDYCLGHGDGTAAMLSGHPDVDVDGDGEPDGVRLDLDGDGVIDDALADFDAGRRISIPSKRYRVIATVSKHLPVALLQRFQSLGRR